MLKGRCLLEGSASGKLLFSHVPLSFWGGTDPILGKVVDAHHPLRGTYLAGHILAIPAGRGSCSGSGAILQMLLSSSGPAALIFSSDEEILTAGVIVAGVLFNKQIPVVVLSPGQFAMLEHVKRVSVSNGAVCLYEADLTSEGLLPALLNRATRDCALSAMDEDMLSGKQGKARAAAMEILLKFAKAQAAEELIDVSQAHLDSVHYTGPATTIFAEYMLSLGNSSFAVPTTMNSISIDQRRWKVLGVCDDFAEKSNHLANTYVAMGGKETFTCAPYLLDTAPSAGQHIGWAESNAVVFANSVLGAHTQKYPDMIEVCVALTGRAPLAGCHKEEGRAPLVAVRVPSFERTDDSLWPVLGYRVGYLSGNRIPLVLGLESRKLTNSDLKAFGAAFATTSSAPMFHIRGSTPGNYINRRDMQEYTISLIDARETWNNLNTTQNPAVSVVALGNPHFSIEEFRYLAQLTRQSKGKRAKGVQLLITTSRYVLQAISSEGVAERLYDFGADIITDTCWCMIEEPVARFANVEGTVMTNSAKYAHYAPGIINRPVHFGSLRECVLASISGQRASQVPQWV